MLQLLALRDSVLVTANDTHCALINYVVTCVTRKINYLYYVAALHIIESFS